MYYHSQDKNKPKKEFRYPSKYKGCKNLSLLVVDDDTSLVKFFKIHLSQYFAAIYVASDATGALKHLSLHNIDMVLTDYEMPGHNGMWLLRQIQELYPHIAVLMMSEAPLPETSRKSILNDTAAWQQKPLEISDIHTLIQQGVTALKKSETSQKQPATNKKKRA